MPPLLGREGELAAIETLLASAADGGGSSLLLRGEPGIGKTALVEAAARAAAARGFHVLRTAGVATEASMPFAALQQLVQPSLAGLDALALPQREALATAVGLRHGDSPQTFLIALAVLDLLSEASVSAPTLLVVEDAHWLDDPTAEVLGFVARRLELEPMLALFTARDGQTARIDAARLPELELTGLDDESAGRLLESHAPGLPPGTRARVLELARGNPLALLELPQSPLDLSAVDLPLTERLERAFSERVDELPRATRTALLVAALDEGGDLAATLSAASMLEGEARSVATLAPAEEARLVSLGTGVVRFRHPLVRAAVGSTATTSDRRAAHAALARAYTADPDRGLWHQAAALDGPDESVASRLEDAADRAERRGAPSFSAAALARAAALTPDETLRGTRLVRAAEAEFALGRPYRAHELLAQARSLALDAERRARVAFIVDISDDANWTGAASAASIAALADDLIAAGDKSAALDALQMVALRLWWGNPDPDVRSAVVALAERAAEREDDPVLLHVLALADPVGRGSVVRARVARHAPDQTAPVPMLNLGYAANATYSDDLALPFLSAAVEGFRRQGRLGMLGEALTAQAYVAMHLAKAPLATAASVEAERIAHDGGRPLWAVSARLVRAIVAAERGRDEEADALLTEAEALLTSMGAHQHLGVVQFARGRGAVAHGRYEDGYFHLRRLFDPADIAYQPLVGLWGLSDLVESAHSTERHEEATRHLAELQRVAAASEGSLLHAQLAYARPLVAPDDEAGALYEAALAHGLLAWPCYRGRLLLNYGRWLRRQRRVAESRAPLRAARELFDALGFAGMAESARGELRASGEASRKRLPDLRDQLTPQELQIAQMAAQGLTNREIGSRLYLSHRTVGSHLYRLFPKLGITSRSQLGEALAHVE